MLAADASLEVTRALLHADFGVTWELQQGQLVPPVANRANYIHWLEDLLRLSSPVEPAQACGESLPTQDRSGDPFCHFWEPGASHKSAG